jgi:hypothetical protein
MIIFGAAGLFLFIWFVTILFQFYILLDFLYKFYIQKKLVINQYTSNNFSLLRFLLPVFICVFIFSYFAYHDFFIRLRRFDFGDALFLLYLLCCFFGFCFIFLSFVNKRGWLIIKENFILKFAIMHHIFFISMIFSFFLALILVRSGIF